MEEVWSTYYDWEKDRLSCNEYCIKTCVSVTGETTCCSGSLKSGNSWYSVIVDTLERNEGTALVEVTIAIQGTLDRMDRVPKILASWEGPAVVVLNAAATSISERQSLMAEFKSGSLTWRKDILVAVFIDDIKAGEKWDTPVNTLRNLGIDLAPTNHVFVSDIDFLPSVGLSRHLQTSITPLLTKVDRSAIVVPHFELKDCTPAAKVPTHLTELVLSITQGESQPFHGNAQELFGSDVVSFPDKASSRCTGHPGTWSNGIQETNYKEWLRLAMQTMVPKESNRATVAGVFLARPVRKPTLNGSYEPFMITRKVEASGVLLPRYPEHFTGRYMNKVAYTATLAAYKYRLYTIVPHFIVHMPHPVKKDLDVVNADDRTMKRKWYEEYVSALLSSLWDSPLHPPPTTKTMYDGGFFI
jgi:hypothetical protein